MVRFSIIGVHNGGMKISSVNTNFLGDDDEGGAKVIVMRKG